MSDFSYRHFYCIVDPKLPHTLKESQRPNPYERGSIWSMPVPCEISSFSWFFSSHHCRFLRETRDRLDSGKESVFGQLIEKRRVFLRDVVVTTAIQVYKERQSFRLIHFQLDLVSTYKNPIA